MLDPRANPKGGVTGLSGRAVRKFSERVDAMGDGVESGVVEHFGDVVGVAGGSSSLYVWGS